jgi:hypothetical protein
VNQRLHSLKLRALVRDHLTVAIENGSSDVDSGALASAVEAQPFDIGIGAALTVADQAWVLIEEREERSLGICLAWMHRTGAESLHVLTSENVGIIARRAEHFALGITVWHVRDRVLEPASPSLHLDEALPNASHLAFESVIIDSGADLVVEHGVVSGEVLGLEVCRVVEDPLTAQPRLEVGVGVHDREAFAIMHGETPIADSLKRIVDVVRRHRQPGADPHPLNRLAAERALRCSVLADPGRIGLGTLSPVSAATPRPNLKDSFPCAAIGKTESGETAVAVFSTGIDLDVVPTAADIRSWHGAPDAQLLIVVPERDASPVTKRLASTLHKPATVVGIAST